MKTILIPLLIMLTLSATAVAQDKILHVFVMDRDQQHELGGKTQAEERFDLAWHYWGDVDLIEEALGKGLPSDRDNALEVMKRRVDAMTESDKTALGNAWRGRHMASDLGIKPENMPAVWADGRVFTYVEDLRHVFSRIK